MSRSGDCGFKLIHYPQGQIVSWELSGLHIGCQGRGFDFLAELIEPQ